MQITLKRCRVKQFVLQTFHIICQYVVKRSILWMQKVNQTDSTFSEIKQKPQIMSSARCFKGLRHISLNRKEGNDQESIQLPNTFCPRQQKGKKDPLKATAPQSKHYKQKAKGRFLSRKLAKRLSKIKISPGHTCKDIQ